MEQMLLLTGVGIALTCLCTSLKWPGSNKIRWSMQLVLLAILATIPALRAFNAGHPPFTNLYETLLLLNFLIGLRLILTPGQFVPVVRNWIIFVIAALNGIAWALPPSQKIIKPLMPALNSIWMVIHVPSYFIAYMALLIALIQALYYYFKFKRSSKVTDNTESELRIYNRIHIEVYISFFFLLTGLWTGAIWAYYSWGNYWSWDVKETWALINIMILSLYFFIPKKRVYFVIQLGVIILTFLSVFFTYWGVSYLLYGMHSYQ